MALSKQAIELRIEDLKSDEQRDLAAKELLRDIRRLPVGERLAVLERAFIKYAGGS